uniref:Uncharacterized protein n=1 Tax=Calidris pygmaea TaxID=425635 RepID=A0A8C3K8F8_9CHAR
MLLRAFTNTCNAEKQEKPKGGVGCAHSPCVMMKQGCTGELERTDDHTGGKIVAYFPVLTVSGGVRDCEKSSAILGFFF